MELVHISRDTHSDQELILIDHLNSTFAIHQQLLDSMTATSARPSPQLGELLEEIANRYLDFSELIADQASSKSNVANLEIE